MPYLLKIMLVLMPEGDTILLNFYPNCYIYAHKQHMDTLLTDTCTHRCTGKHIHITFTCVS